MNILLIEDDERITGFVARGLRAEGYSVDTAATGEEGLELGRGKNLALIILDLLLPDMDGRAVCKTLRQKGVKTPILMLTALDSLDDRVEGLRMGADDYLAKPFAFEELLARIEALIRRSSGFEERKPRLSLADLELDRETLEVRRAGKLIEMTAKEIALLEFLLASEGRVVSRARILENVWGQTSDPLTNVVDVYVRRLRAKIDHGFDPPLIHTVRGHGYRMTAGAK
ncbi:MAG TPA: response regulator transcription factor [Alphaproteobacteria bacterium]|nr:response regulator transcription factor [Alphaproteobacteria bacterium]